MFKSLLLIRAQNLENHILIEAAAGNSEDYNSLRREQVDAPRKVYFYNHITTISQFFKIGKNIFNSSLVCFW